MMLLALALAVQCPDGSPPPCRTVHAIAVPAMSVAVLTFENRSRDSADTFLGDGLADEIATQLGGLRRLTVRSRTVVRRLRGAESMSVPDLGRALSAAYLVNGTIQRAGSAVRVEVELLRATTGEQAWAQRFDEAAGDLFQVQSTVAEAVSQAIAGRLAPQEHAELARRPTRNNEAYQLFLRAISALSRNDYRSVDSALVLLERAVTLDSAFAEAWAQLSRVRMNRYFNSVDRSPANVSAARDAALRAQRLAPDLPETHLALGYFAYWGSLDYRTAQSEFTAALQRRPGDSDTWIALARIARRQGHFDAALEHLHRALAADPGNLDALSTLEDTLLRLHRIQEADRIADSAESRGMPAATTMTWRCMHAYSAGDAAAAARPCGRAIELAAGQPFQQILVGLVALPLDSSVSILVDRIPRPAIGYQLSSWYALMLERWSLAGDTVRFRAYADSAIAALRDAVAADTSDADLHMFFAEALSQAGHHDEALREMDHAIVQLPLARDAIDGNDAQFVRVMVLARSGRLDEALQLAERVRDLPSVYSVASLHLATGLAFLGADPRYRRLLEH